MTPLPMPLNDFEGHFRRVKPSSDIPRKYIVYYLRSTTCLHMKSACQLSFRKRKTSQGYSQSCTL